MLSRRQKRVVIGAGALVLVVLFAVPFIRVNNYREYVADSLSQALGRKVTVQSIELKTFPQPGLLLRGLVVADDPAISAEPMLRADEVLATLHVSSLWRRRLEINKLRLSSPSLNLVRVSDGRWNVESLLERARQTSTAPTGKTRPESRARFPYIESDLGRINLKIGREKKVFALGEADFALWLNAEDEWRMRLEARPLRTDANLSNVGTLKVEGSWGRADQLRKTPLLFRVWWEDAQLGQLTTLVYGLDRGWRGAFRSSMTIGGTPDNLNISVDGKLDDFRRYDIATSDSVSLQAHCDANYSLTHRIVRQFDCRSALGGGVVRALGTFSLGSQDHGLDISTSVENVPVQSLAYLVRHMKKDVPQDITVTGTITGAFSVRANDAGQLRWTGNGVTTAMLVQSSVLSEPLAFDSVTFRLAGAGTSQTAAAPLAAPLKKGKSRSNEFVLPGDKTVLTWNPIQLPAKRTSPATLNGWISQQGYTLALNGEAELARLSELARLIGLPTPAAEVNGVAKGNLHMSGNWEGFKLPDFLADAHLSSVTAKISGVSSPLLIQGGQFTVNEYFGILKAAAKFSRMPSNMDFSVFWPKQCILQQPQRPACTMRIDLNADQLNVDEINSLFNPRAQKRPWYAAITDAVTRAKRQSLPKIYASGKVTASKLVWKDVSASHLSSSMEITPDGFTLRDISAEVLGGRYSGTLTADLTKKAPAYSSKGRFQNVGVANVAVLMRDSWASGKVTTTYEGTASGWNAQEIIASAAGSSSFEWRDGVLHHIDLDSNGKPLQFRLFAGGIELKNGVFSVRESKLQAAKSIYVVSGTASLGRELEFKLAREGAPSFSVSGTLERPRIAPLPVPQTQATLR